MARHFNANYGVFQTDDPAAAGYVTIGTDAANVRFETDVYMASGPHGGFRAPEPALAFRVAEGRLEPGESVTITYGDTTGGGPGVMMTQTSGARTPFPLYGDLDGAGEWRPLPILPFAVVGTTVAGVHGFAPSVVRPGESFELSVRAEDRFYNRATGDIPGFDVVVGGEVRASTEAGSEAITVVELALDEPGVYWTTLRSRDVEPQITGGANPILVVEDREFGIYWGDTHGHSGYAEGIGTLDFFLQFARDDARLDFVTHSEHDTALDASEWELMRAKSAEYDEPGRFIPYRTRRLSVWSGAATAPPSAPTRAVRRAPFACRLPMSSPGRRSPWSSRRRPRPARRRPSTVRAPSFPAVGCVCRCRICAAAGWRSCCRSRTTTGTR